MKKLFTAASVGLLALTIFGCGKKTTKNTTKDNTTTAQKTTKNTTKKTTQTKTTTKDAKKEFKLVSQEAYMDAVDKISTKNPYIKMTINGTVSDSFENESSTYENEVLRLNSSYYFVGPDNSLCGLGFIAHDFANHHGTGEKLYMNEYGEFMAERNVNISDTEDATLFFTYNNLGYLVSVETKNKKTITGVSEYDDFLSMDITIEYSETDVIDGFEAIKYADFKNIVDERALVANPYPACIFNGTSKKLTTNDTTTITDALLKLNSSGYYYSSEFSFFGMADIKASDKDDLYNTIYYKNNNDVLRTITYATTEDDVHIIKDYIYESNNFVKKVSESVYSTKGTITESNYIYNFEVEHLEEIPSVTVTLNAGYGKFSDDSKTKEIKIEQNTIFNDFMSSATYTEPTLSGAQPAKSLISSMSGWFDENGCEVSRGMYIKSNMTITYGFIDSKVGLSPAFISSFDVNAAKESTVENKNTIKLNFDYDTDVLNATLFYDTQKYYYITDKTFTYTYDLEKATASTMSILVYSAFNKFSLSNDKGPLSQGNNFLTYVQILAKKVDIDDYAFYQLTGIKSFIMPDQENNYTIGSHAFDGCTNLENVTVFPTTIKSYAFANSGLKGMLSGSVLQRATVVEDNVFTSCSNLDSILVEIELKEETLEDESVVYYYDDECFTKPEGWSSNWNCGKEIKLTPSNVTYSMFNDGVKICLFNGQTSSIGVTLQIYVPNYKYDIHVHASSTYNLNNSYVTVSKADGTEIVKAYYGGDNTDDATITYNSNGSYIQVELYNPYYNEYSTYHGTPNVYFEIKKNVE